ncbi:type II CAAX endopeptidase family protein [Gemella sp. 27098_8_92]|uniref:CPBP family intramembrane glutamic endopeptidase n=1 Tax=Gemella sp. 27098_8_92 TaxID=3003687 RepID=UPI00352F97E9
MRVSFQRGDIKHLITSGVIYFVAVFIIPSLLPLTLSVNSRLNISLGIAALATIIMIFIASRSHNDIDRGKKESTILLNIAIGLAGFVAMMLLQGVINWTLQYLSEIFEFQASSKNTSNVVQIIKLNPLFIVYVIFLGPIMEELFFRKAVFGYFYDIMLGSKRWIRFVIPALITGILFAIPHDGFSPIMILYIMMSFVFSFLYLKTKSILTPMVAHITMNTIVVIAQLAIQ